MSHENPVRKFIMTYHQTTIYIAVVVTLLLIIEIMEHAVIRK